MSPPPAATASGFDRIHVVSTAIVPHAAKAAESCRGMLSMYPEIATYTVVVDRTGDRAWSALPTDSRMRLLHEDEVYPKPAWDSRYREMAKFSPNRSGWYYQQILKLAHLIATALKLRPTAAAGTDGFLIWDADTRILRPIPFYRREEQRTYSYYTPNRKERHPPFYAINARLTGTAIEDRQTQSHIVQFAALDSGEIDGFVRFLGLEPAGGVSADLLAERVVSAIRAEGLSSEALFSEYELIALFKKLRLVSPLRNARFIRTNDQLPSDRQLALMRRFRIDHFTYEGRGGAPNQMRNGYLLGQLVLQNVPALEIFRRPIHNSPCEFS